jgi:hypothetical protein
MENCPANSALLQVISPGLLTISKHDPDSGAKVGLGKCGASEHPRRSGGKAAMKSSHPLAPLPSLVVDFRMIASFIVHDREGFGTIGSTAWDQAHNWHAAI